METSLHQQLKQIYAAGEAQIEVPLGKYRIDVVTDSCLIEIQHGSLSAIRDKVRDLVKRHRVLVVKPIIRRKQILKQASKDGPIQSQRQSPKKGKLLDLFDELVYFTRAFPHRNLRLEVLLVDIEERRYPRRRSRRRTRKNYRIADQKLLEIQTTRSFSRARDLLTLIPGDLPRPFTTADLAASLGVQRWIAQRIAYCLRETGSIKQTGKRRNTLLYELRPPTSRCTRRAA